MLLLEPATNVFLSVNREAILDLMITLIHMLRSLTFPMLRLEA